MNRPSWFRIPSWARLPERQDAPPAETARRWARGALAAALAVAVIAGIVSYSHIVALGLRTSQGPTDAHLLPFAIDGLIVAGSMILAAGSALGWLGVVPGVAATLFANLQFGLPHGALSAAVSTWPAVAFTVACFMLERWLRRRRLADTSDGSDAVSSGFPNHTELAANDAETGATRVTGSDRVRDILKASPTLAKADVAKLARVSERTVERAKQTLNGSGK